MDKETIFERYLNGHSTIDEVIVSLDCLQEKDIKSKGVVYTPWSIVQKMIDMVKIEPYHTIIEPACGHGIFVFGLLEFARNQWEMNPEQLLVWFLNHVKAIEINPETIKELKQTLKLYFQKQGVLHQDFSNILEGDGLYLLLQTNKSSKFNICIGNPPYVRTRELEKNYLSNLRKNFLSCSRGNVDIYYAFIERYSQICEKVCLITPNSFLQNDSAKILRNLIFPKITQLIDFREKLIFADARTYTCIFILEQTNTDMCLYATDINALFKTIKKDSLVKNLENTTTTIAEIYSGLATLADAIYTVKKQDGKFYAYLDNKAFEIEKGILAPYIKITKQRNSDYSKIDFMIYPYDENKKVMAEEHLQKEFPKTYSYLQQARPFLMNRDRGKTQHYEAWYAYGRKQGLHHITAPYILAIPRMIGGNCLPQKLDVSSLQKEFGKFVFTSGYVIPLMQNDNKTEHKILSGDFMAFYKANGKVWPGKNEPYYSLSVKQIKKFNGG